METKWSSTVLLKGKREKGSVPRIIAFFEPPIRPFNPSHDRSTEMRFLKLRQYAGLTPLQSDQ